MQRLCSKLAKWRGGIVLLQVIREFWVPFLVAVLWTSYNFINGIATDYSFISIVKILAPAFFLASWATGQYFRIKKQTRTEHELQSIQDKSADLIEKIETKTDELLKNISGGDSFCYLAFANLMPGSDVAFEMVVHQGSYPLSEVVARIVDLQAFDAVGDNLSFQNMAKTERSIDCGLLIPQSSKLIGRIDLGKYLQRDFNIFWSARNGHFSQAIRCRKIEEKWVWATQVKRGKVIFEKIDEKFPRNPDGTVTW